MAARIIRMVERDTWCLSATLGERSTRLLDVPEPEQLIGHVIAEANDAAHKGGVQLDWEGSGERTGFSRLIAQVPLTETTFDQLWNGRSGYRAQYYLSPEEGILFNRDVLDGLLPAISVAYDKQPLTVAFNVVEQSLRAPHSKIWIFEETEAFNEAESETLNPERWVTNNATSGRKTPLPRHYKIDVKGTFLGPGSQELFVGPLKLDRPCDLFNRGYA